MLKWFSKKKEQELAPLDFSLLKTDMHSHLIPGIDDGAPDLQGASINILKKLQQLGFQKVVTTPHIMSDFTKTPQRILRKALRL